MTVKGMDDLKDFLKAMKERGREAAIDGIHNYLDYAFEISQKACPIDTGILRASGEVIKTKNGGAITYKAPYALAVHDGYAQHEVRPKRRRALRWEVGRKERLTAKKPRKGAQWAFSKGHKVPRDKKRSKPNPFLDNTIRATSEHIPTFIFQEFDKLVEAS